MSYYEIEGGRRLTGSVKLFGAKNVASKLIIASLLTKESCILTNVPAIGEIDIALELVASAGAKVSHAQDSVTIHAETVSEHDLHNVAARNRISILMIGPLLFRTGSAWVPPVTGDQIGRRPVGFHIDALSSLGVRIEQSEQGFQAVATQLKGCPIRLPYPSVGATETILLTSSWANGRTTIDNAAVEPEILALIQYLQSMGAAITVDKPSRRIVIEGVKTFTSAAQRVLPDRLEAVSYASIALATGGDILIDDARAEDLESYLNFVHRINGGVEYTNTGIRITNTGPLRPTALETAVHPGFMSDWQQPSVVVLALANGTSYIHETVYEDRLRYTADLRRMGADITVSPECYGEPCRFYGRGHPHSAKINGPVRLQATQLEIPDIRAGMAHVVAALVASGTSKLTGIHHLDRGYGQGLLTKLQGLGAKIKRVEE